MALNLNLPKIDVDLVNEGKWFQFTEEVAFKVARSMNREHKRAMQNRYKEFDRLREKGDFKKIEVRNNEFLARYILKDWRGLVEEGGKELPFSYEAALSIISDPQYEAVKAFISECAESRDEFETSAEDIVKN